MLVLALLLGTAAVYYSLVGGRSYEAERDRKTTEALALAKAALIGHATSLPVYANNSPANRIGDLPCPDLDDDGIAESACGNGTGSTGQTLRIGRLPWRTLGLPDLRDGDGERLWYAVSSNFKNNTRSSCSASGLAGCLNSDTKGTITIRDNKNNIVHNATNSDPLASGAVAVVFSPGPVLRRLGSPAAQDRSCPGAFCNAALVCNPPVTSAPKCNPVNYLDTNGTEDNANFVDGSGTDGFIHGIFRDGTGNVIVNDRLMVITYQDIMPRLEERVAGEVLKCLTTYAAANSQRYPWAAPPSTVTGSFNDATNTLFGRIPDRPMTRTQLGTVSPATPLGIALTTSCSGPNPLCMSPYWVAPCQFPTDSTVQSWWMNWKLQVFYAIADAHKPMISYVQPTSSTASPTGITPVTGCPSCLTVTPPSTAADKSVVVLIARRRLGAVALGQPRTTSSDHQDPANYLEGSNTSYPTFSQQLGSTTFNDLVVYK